MFGKDINTVFQYSINIATKDQSEFITIDHILLGLLSLNKGKDICQNLGLNTVVIKDSLKKYIQKNIIKLPDNIEHKKPIETLALSNMLTNILLHKESSNQKELYLIDLLIAIYDQEESYSSYLLKQTGLQRYDLLKYATDSESPTTDIEETYQENINPKTLKIEDFTTNLTQKAKDKEFDPIFERDVELNSIIRILSKRKKNNPLIIGEPGVGKTALVHKLAMQIAQNEVPSKMKNSQIFEINLGNIVAGTKYRGDFEKRMKFILETVSQKEKPILYIDEIHNIFGTGSTSGSMDAYSLLQPVLAEGKIRFLGTTSYADQKKIFDKNKGFARRFEKVDIKEPNTELTQKILSGLKPYYEKYHQVTYHQNALMATIELTNRYMSEKFLPDKALDLLDEAGAEANLQNLVNKKITEIEIREVLARKLNIPVENIDTKQKNKIRCLEQKISQQIFGQEKAVNELTKAILLNYAGLNEPNKPLGSFLFSGPSGVGKTAISETLAKILGIHFARFDMSEYMEKHTISRLIGSPAGYVGYNEGGLLTETIRKHPHCVLLLDEIEKANSELLNILLQVMDCSILTDASGTKVDFKNVIIIMTSNLGSQEMRQIGFGKENQLQINTAVKDFFSPEFRNRLDSIIQFKPLNQEIMVLIVDKFIKNINHQLQNKNITIELTKNAKKYLAKKGFSSEMGARPLGRLIRDEIKDPLTKEILFSTKNNKNVKFLVDYDNNKIIIK